MILTILSFLFVIMTLVLVHEIGHLVAAKRLRMKVEAFSIGFGPRIAGFRRGETDYILCLVPLGGYVKLSEEPTKDRFDSASAHFADRPPSHKAIVALAGPLANFVLAVVVFALVNVLGVSIPTYMEQPPIVGWVQPDSAGAKAGLQAGDRIVSMDQTPVQTWEEMSKRLPLAAKKEIQVDAMRTGAHVRLVMADASRMTSGLYPAQTIVVDQVASGSPAQSAGFKSGDVIAALDGRAVQSWAQVLYTIAASDNALSFRINRAGRDMLISVKAANDATTGRKLVGISCRQDETIRRYGVAAAVTQALAKTGEVTGASVDAIWQLLTLKMSLKAMGGPLAIAKASGDTAKTGLIPLLGLLAFLSIQLGLFNLVPFIPIVDGGQVSLFVIEAIRRRPFSAPALEWVAKLGWAAMICLIVAVTYNDLLRLF